MTIAGFLAARRGRVTKAAKSETDVVLGEDWVAPSGAVDEDLAKGRQRRSYISLNHSPLARKIITFNLLAMLVMVAGVLYLNPFRDSLVFQRESAIVSEAELIADVFEARMPLSAPVNLAAGDGLDVAEVMRGIELPEGATIYVFDAAGNLLADSGAVGTAPRERVEGLGVDSRSTMLTDLLNSAWDWLTRQIGRAHV